MIKAFSENMIYDSFPGSRSRRLFCSRMKMVSDVHVVYDNSREFGATLLHDMESVSFRCRRVMTYRPDALRGISVKRQTTIKVLKVNISAERGTKCEKCCFLRQC